MGSSSVTSSSVITSTKDTHYLGTVRGRLGFTITPTFLVYGTGGLAYGGVSSSTNVTETLGFSDTPNPFGTFGNFTQSCVGWTAGGGLEWLFAPNWSLKVEYRYYDLGRVTYALAPLLQTGLNGTLLETIGASQSTTRFNGNIVRAGLNYHFNLWGPGPVLAKYYRSKAIPFGQTQNPALAAGFFTLPQKTIWRFRKLSVAFPPQSSG